jgi:uncharacterized protein (DUF2062 family)
MGLKFEPHKAYERFLKIRGEPRQIALGLALGIFIGMLPVLGLQTVSAIFFASLLKWNKIAAALGTLISNPLTIPPLYAITYFVGNKLMGLRHGLPRFTTSGVETLIDMVQKTPEIILALFIGGILLGLPSAAVGYFLSYEALKRYQSRIREKLARQREKLARKRENLTARSRQISHQLHERMHERTARRKKQKSRKNPTKSRTRKK